MLTFWFEVKDFINFLEIYWKSEDYLSRKKQKNALTIGKSVKKNNLRIKKTPIF